MSIFDDMDWENTTERGSKYGEKYKTAKADPNHLVVIRDGQMLLREQGLLRLKKVKVRNF